MKIVIAPDSFKGSLSAARAADIIECAILGEAQCEISKIPMADGGEGMTDAVMNALSGTFREITVKNPLGEPVAARYGIAGSVAVIEMAAASGITLIDKDRRNPLAASTYGTGEMLADAISLGCRRIIMGIGGSATNDGGAGMAQALGAKFFDGCGNPVNACGGSVHKIEKIDVSNILPELMDTKIEVACDVVNPLCGPDGASRVFGPQKGADDAAVDFLDNSLHHFAEKIHEFLGMDVLTLRGGGAAGGLGAGLAAFCKAQLMPGFDVVARITGLEESIKNASLVITGEGCTDSQTIFGKVPSGVGKIAARYNVPCVVISGALKGDLSELYRRGITAAFSCVTSVQSVDDAIQNAEVNLERAARNVIRHICRMSVF